jgi:hypothetical protein
VNYELIRKILADATWPDGAFSGRSLARDAGFGVTRISDILTGKNKNPTIGTLAFFCSEK